MRLRIRHTAAAARRPGAAGAIARQNSAESALAARLHAGRALAGRALAGLVLVPMVLLFLAAQRYFIEGANPQRR